MEYREDKLPARLLTVNEVAHFLGVHANTVRRWGKEGLIRSYAIGPHHNLRFTQEDVIKFLNRCQREYGESTTDDRGLQDNNTLSDSQCTEKVPIGK